MPAPAWRLACARARPMTPITSAMPDGGSWSPASGPARRWPTIAPIARTGCCKGKAHRREYLGYAGRRVLVSRKWSGKTLADHRADRKAWLVETLGLEVPDPARYTWSLVTPGDPDYLSPERRLLHVVADRARWKAALTEARRRAGPPSAELSATDRRAA